MGEDIQIVRVEWVDSVSSCGWESIDDHELHTITSIGIYVKEDNDCIVITTSISEDQCNATIVIPKTCIKERRSFIWNS